MISIEVFSYFEPICICKSFCKAASVYLNIHIVSRAATNYHVLSAPEQLIVK